MYQILLKGTVLITHIISILAKLCRNAILVSLQCHCRCFSDNCYDTDELKDENDYETHVQ